MHSNEHVEDIYDWKRYQRDRDHGARQEQFSRRDQSHLALGLEMVSHLRGGQTIFHDAPDGGPRDDEHQDAAGGGVRRLREAPAGR